MELAPALFLAVCVAAGYGLTYLIGLALSVEERIAFGAVIGAAAVTGVSFAISLVVRDVTVVTVVLALGLVLLAAAAAVVTHKSLVRADFADGRARWLASPRSPGHPWPLVAVLELDARPLEMGYLTAANLIPSLPPISHTARPSP